MSAPRATGGGGRDRVRVMVKKNEDGWCVCSLFREHGLWGAKRRSRVPSSQVPNEEHVTLRPAISPCFLNQGVDVCVAQADPHPEPVSLLLFKHKHHLLSPPSPPPFTPAYPPPPALHVVQTHRGRLHPLVAVDLCRHRVLIQSSNGREVNEARGEEVLVHAIVNGV